MRAASVIASYTLDLPLLARTGPLSEAYSLEHSRARTCSRGNSHHLTMKPTSASARSHAHRLSATHADTAHAGRHARPRPRTHTCICIHTLSLSLSLTLSLVRCSSPSARLCTPAQPCIIQGVRMGSCVRAWARKAGSRHQRDACVSAPHTRTHKHTHTRTHRSGCGMGFRSRPYCAS